MQKHIYKRKQMIEERNKRMQRRFTELYEGKRVRFDDVIQALSNEFCLAPLTIERILQK